jgi:hypothetical protein
VLHSIELVAAHKLASLPQGNLCTKVTDLRLPPLEAEPRPAGGIHSLELISDVPGDAIPLTTHGWMLISLATGPAIGSGRVSSWDPPWTAATEIHQQPIPLLGGN